MVDAEKMTRDKPHFEPRGDDQMRTTVELIEELSGEAAKFSAAYLIVGFESTNMTIRATDPDALKLLNEAVQSGGKPIGLIGVVWDGKTTRSYNRVLAEYVEEPWAHEFMNKVTDAKDKMVTDYLAVREKGWLN
jgi:hypothetical protein